MMTRTSPLSFKACAKADGTFLGHRRTRRGRDEGKRSNSGVQRLPPLDMNTLPI